MDDDQFTKLFKYVQAIDKKFDRLEVTAATKDDIGQVLNALDGYASNLDTYAQEFAAMDHKLSRLEKYIQVLADKAGVDLNTIRL